VGVVEPPSGSTVTAAACMPPAGSAKVRINARPSESTVKTGPGTGYPFCMTQSW
jgi:hypothetical protein